MLDLTHLTTWPQCLSVLEGPRHLPQQAPRSPGPRWSKQVGWPRLYPELCLLMRTKQIVQTVICLQTLCRHEFGEVLNVFILIVGVDWVPSSGLGAMTVWETEKNSNGLLKSNVNFRFDTKWKMTRTEIFGSWCSALTFKKRAEKSQQRFVCGGRSSPAACAQLEPHLSLLTLFL